MSMSGSGTSCIGTYRVIFLIGSAPKSVEDGKSLPKKWKSELKYNILLLKRPTFAFLVGILPSSTLRTLWCGTSQKTHPVCRERSTLWILSTYESAPLHLGFSFKTTTKLSSWGWLKGGCCSQIGFFTIKSRTGDLKYFFRSLNISEETKCGECPDSLIQGLQNPDLCWQNQLW